MSIITFFLLSLIVFLIITVGGIIFYKNKSEYTLSAAIATENSEYRLANAIPSPNDYENFDNVLEVVLKKYPKSYKAAGQVYNNYERSE